KHNYTYINCHWPTGATNPYMNKIRYIQAYYHLFDYLFWIDDDAFFMDFDKPLTDFLPDETSFLSICSSPDHKKIHTYISSGQFFLRCDEVGKSFIDSIEKTDLTQVKDWWTEELGFFTNGDQDAMVYLLKTKDLYRHYNLHHFSKFNSRVEDFFNSSPVFILHFTGNMDVKNQNYQKIQQATGFGPSLLADQHKALISYQDPKTFSQKVLSRLKQYAGSVS
ncbi:MAG: hypothetical protein OXE99_14910, partial [Cellvibrionales bacterium]|nr:hypothetical protein [Cellvibrionales bacterium]